LVIPDSHATPGHDNDRFEWLGNLIVSVQPELIVNIGDMGHMGSLSLFDVGKRKAEGQRYECDVAVTIDANERLFAPIRDYNRRNLRAGGEPYNPPKVITLGNHEERINRATQLEPKWHGHISMDDLQYEKFGWEVIPFLEPFVDDEIVYQHYFTAGLKDMSISGLNAARRLTQIDGRTHVAGHSHLLQTHREGRGRERWGIQVGCYFEHMEDYLSVEGQADWWRGIVLLREVDSTGYCEPQFITLKTIKRNFS
jgi:hypothetical protein